MKNNKIIFISSIGPGNGGAGRFVSKLVSEVNNSPNKNDIKFLFLEKGIYAPRLAFLNKKYFLTIFLIIKKFIRFLYFNISLFFCLKKHSKVIFILPNLLKHRFFVKITKNSQQNYLYVLDNSFFCLKHYNKLSHENFPCLRCLDNIKSHLDFNCGLDERNKDLKYIEYLTKLNTEGKIKFLAQNLNQKKLLEKFFLDSETTVVGMIPHDFPSEFPQNYSSINSNQKIFDIVYHGPDVDAKGISWVLELSQKLPQYSFLLPINCTGIPKDKYLNCTFNAVNWETGLEFHIRNAKIILVPSIWTAPIEGALIKSIIYGKIVATFSFPFAFSSELPPKLIITLEPDINLSANIISKAIENDTFLDLKEKMEWHRTFLSSNKQFLSNILAYVRK
jgi:hypothetical protein